MSYVIAVDVGGTGIKCALIDSQLNVLETARTPTPKGDRTGEATVDSIANLYRDLAENYEILALGLAVPGTLDEPNGIARWAGNLQWQNLKIVDLVKNKLNIPVAFRHDVRAGAYAEQKFGSLKGVRDGIFIPIGTGIASAIILDGEIRAANGYAGEVGHISVGSDRKCVCGRQGCLEATSSTLAISSEYSKRTGKNLSTLEIVSAVKSDATADQVWQEAIRGISTALLNLTTLLAPEVIVIGGGLSESGEPLLSSVRDNLYSHLTFQRKPELKLAHFGSLSGTIGCGLIAWELFNDKQ
jgi:glucokinase